MHLLAPQKPTTQAPTFPIGKFLKAHRLPANSSPATKTTAATEPRREAKPLYSVSGDALTSSPKSSTEDSSMQQKALDRLKAFAAAYS